VSCSRSRAVWPSLLLGLLAGACGPAPSAHVVRLESATREGERVIVAIPAAGYRINARVPPALELRDGGILRLATGHVLPDSSYFVEPPWAPRPHGVRLRGVLRVSVCRDTERLCRTAAVPVDLRD
jgi:hypothetical protein